MRTGRDMTFRRGLTRILSFIMVTAFIVFIATRQQPSVAQASNSSSNKVVIRSDRALTINDQPFFPLGFFHVSLDGTEAKRLSDMRLIAAGGFNTFLCTEIGSDANFGSLLDEADKSGIYVIPGVTNPSLANNLNFVNLYKNYEALLGYYIADDADTSTFIDSNPATRPASVKNINTQIKAADPNHITTLALSGLIENMPNYMDVSDTAAMESYPVPIPGLSLNDTNVTFTNAQIASQQSNRPIWGSLQSFPWSGYRAPTYDEIRVMSYTSIINNVKGIIFYTFFHTGWDIGQQSTYWQDLQKLPPEINKITPYILNGSYRQISTGFQYEVYAASWVYNNRILVIAVDSSDINAHNISLSLPITATKANVLLAGSDGLSLANNKLSGTIAPHQVMAYVLDTNNLPATSIAINKIASQTNAKPGDQITYQLLATNPTTENYINVNISDAIPENSEYVQGSASSGVSCDTSGCDKTSKSLSWILPKLAPGGEAQLKFTVILK